MKYLTIIITTILIAVIAIPKSDYQVEAEFSVPAKVEKVAPLDTPLEVGVSTAFSSPVVSEPVIPKNELEQMICDVFGDACPEALKIAFCESGIREEAIGDHALTYVHDGVEYGKSYGIFQIRHLQGRPDPEYLLNAKNNIEYAYNNIFKPQGGWQAWSCSYELATNY